MRQEPLKERALHNVLSLPGKMVPTIFLCLSKATKVYKPLLPGDQHQPISRRYYSQSKEDGIKNSTLVVLALSWFLQSSIA